MTANEESRKTPVLTLGQSGMKIPQDFDAAEDRDSVKAALRDSPEIERLTAQIDVSDLETIVTFGADSAGAIAKASDEVLRSMSLTQVDESGKMLTLLADIMDRFDPDEINAEPGFWDRLLGRTRKQLEKLLEKYGTIGDEVDRIYVQLRGYEDEITASNRHLETMFQANVDYFHELEKYIVAGEQGITEMADCAAQLKERYEQTRDASVQFELQSLQQAQMMLEQRVQDLRTAENVAMQSIPMIRTMEYNNMNLVRKINSAFVVTLPVFRQALAQAIMLKRQRIQGEAMAALDKRTNELLKRNAAGTAEAAKLSALLATGSAVKTETLENTWHTIMDGITEARRIRDDADRKRDEDRERLEKLKKDFERVSGTPVM